MGKAAGSFSYRRAFSLAGTDVQDRRNPCSAWPESAFMMTGIRVQHRSESVFTFDRNGRSGWAGIRTGYGIDKLGKVLIDLGVESEIVSRSVQRFREVAYPDDFMVVRELLADPPEAPVRATAFRETNIGVTKISIHPCLEVYPGAHLSD